MKYASESGGVLTSIHQWKPIPPERFATLLHYHSTIVANEHGHDAVNTTAMILDRDTTATVWYRAKTRGDGVSSPVLITLEGPSGKVICFEHISPSVDCDPKPAIEVIRDFKAWAESNRRERLKAVAVHASAQGQRVLVVLVNERGRRDVEGMIGQVISGRNAQVHYVSVPEVGGVFRTHPDRAPYSGVWMHDAGNMGQAVLNGIMHQIAGFMGGEGWLAFTGDMPMGWASPEGLPTERV